ncbi:MAG: S-layer homology domain-containing protein, partial [Firmicutes bacterium]|nr:S-layer homology domain-containing protein [Bacillota bacterium]
AQQKGIIEGYDEGGVRVYKPEANVSRQECMTMLYRVLAAEGLVSVPETEEAPGSEPVSQEVPAQPSAADAAAEAGEEGAPADAQTEDAQGETAPTAESGAEDAAQAQSGTEETAEAETAAETALETASAGDPLILKWASVMERCGIAPWAQRYCAYGFESGILSEADFAGEGSSFGGAAPATREQIARWCARAMDYALSPLIRSVYPDEGSISADNIAYIDALYRNHIMEGSSDGLFHPKDGVKRCEMAAICTRLMGLDERMNSKAPEGPVISFRAALASADAAAGTLSFSSPDAVYRLAEGARIALDGEAAELGALSGLEGKTLNVFAYAGGEDSVSIQSVPRVLSASLRGYSEREYGAGRGSYTLLTLELDNGIRANYIVDGDSDAPSSLRRNRSYTFISDGILILEMR